jgi:hypothetical protein
MVEWQVFNAAAGNADGHGKNLSILYDDEGPRLAPFYDLVSTREYPKLDRLLAMTKHFQRGPQSFETSMETCRSCKRCRRGSRSKCDACVGRSASPRAR